MSLNQQVARSVDNGQVLQGHVVQGQVAQGPVVRGVAGKGARPAVGHPEARTRRPKAVTREIILERAYEMYLARELVHGDERLSLVLDGLGYTTGAGYQIWPNQAAFRLDLQVYIAGRIERASLAPLADRLSELGAEELSFDEYLLVVGDLYIDNFVASEGLYLALRFYAMGDDRPTEITEAMRNAHLRTDRDLEAVLQVAIERADRRLGEGHSMAQLTATVTALAEGFALRHRVGAEVEPVDLGARKHHPFSEALRAVVYQYTEDVAQRAG